MNGEQGIRVGTLLLGTWRIERRIGTGGMAAVYAARHERNGGRVAVKVLHPDASCEPETVRRFRREGYLANAVMHPGVVRVYDDGETSDGCAFLLMDLLEGETLEDLAAAAGGKLPFEQAITYARHVLGILAATHDERVVHRDVKPANVFVCKNGDVKLLDFGIATMTRTATSSSRTSTGAGWGTVRYMAPEQITGEGARGACVDVWAVGVMLYKLVSGRFPFEAKTLLELASLQRTRPLTLDRLVPGFPADMALVVDRALHADPCERWVDARAMLRALEEAEEKALRTTLSDADEGDGDGDDEGDDWSNTTLALATVRRIPSAKPVAAKPLAAVTPEPPVTQSRPASRSVPAARKYFGVGLLALSVATFLGTAAYAVGQAAPSEIADGTSAVLGSSK